MPGRISSYSTKRFLSSSSSRSSSSKNDYSKIYVILSILLFVIIVGSIFFSNRRENFTNENKGTLIYLHMEGCGHCKTFSNEVWDKFKKDKDLPFNIVDYNIDDKSKGSSLAEKENINYAPALIYMTDKGNEIYEGERSKGKIMEWIDKLNDAKSDKKK